jgi:uncharacterized membrane protein HdeD (DUF308 family)
MNNVSRSYLHRVSENMGPSMPSTLREELGHVGKNWGWLLGGGVASIILGVAAFTWPERSTVGLIFALGWFFLIGGFVRIAQAIQLRNEIGTGWRVFDSILSLAAGVLLLRYPGGGMFAVTIAMTFFFFMSAVSKSTVAFATRPHPGSGWAFVSAVASFALGIYMLLTFPVSALWVPGALLGIDFVIYGISLTGVSFKLRDLHKEIEQAVGKPVESKKVA